MAIQVDGIPENYPNDVCLMGQGALCCSYLLIGSTGACCAKGTGFQALIEKRRAEKSMLSMGDNCSGPDEFTVPSQTESPS